MNNRWPNEHSHVSILKVILATKKTIKIIMLCKIIVIMAIHTSKSCWIYMLRFQGKKLLVIGQVHIPQLLTSSERLHCMVSDLHISSLDWKNQRMMPILLCLLVLVFTVTVLSAAQQDVCPPWFIPDNSSSTGCSCALHTRVESCVVETSHYCRLASVWPTMTQVDPVHMSCISKLLPLKISSFFSFQIMYPYLMNSCVGR